MIVLTCSNPTCSKQLDVSPHLPAAAVLRSQRWRVVDGELLCERCAWEGEGDG